MRSSSTTRIPSGAPWRTPVDYGLAFTRRTMPYIPAGPLRTGNISITVEWAPWADGRVNRN